MLPKMTVPSIIAVALAIGVAAPALASDAKAPAKRVQQLNDMQMDRVTAGFDFNQFLSSFLAAYGSQCQGCTLSTSFSTSSSP
jgi:hypothetical protein